jgi:hypothetical protein
MKVLPIALDNGAIAILTANSVAENTVLLDRILRESL